MTHRAKAISVLMVGASLTLLLVGWPVVAHYRVKARLESYKARLRAEGEKMAIAELAPSLSSADVGAGIALDRTAGQLPSISSNPPPLMKLTSPGRVLVAWEQETLSNGDVSNVWAALSIPLEDNADKLAEIRAVLQGYSPAFNLNYEQGYNLLLPHLARLKGAAQWLSAATVFELHEVQATNAIENLAALTALARKTDREPLMISELVRIAVAAIGMATSWEALQCSDLREEALMGLQKSWESVDFLAQAESTLAMERAMGAKTFVAGRQSYSVIANGGFSSGLSGSALAELTQLGKAVLDNPKEGLQSLAHRYPGYWKWKLWQSYDDELASAEAIQASLEAVRTARKGHVFGPALKDLEKRGADIRKSHPLAGQWLGYSIANDQVITKFVARIARIEMERTLLITAVALKRYQVKYRSYPQELAALTPEFVDKLPQDPMDGQPLRYRLRSDGSFLLYSVGDDGQDNGGDATPDATAPKQWLRARDAVWPVPATQVEAQAEIGKLLAEWKKKDVQAAERIEFQKRYGLLPSTPQPSGITNQSAK